MLPSLEELKNPPFHHEMILVEGGTFMMGSKEGEAHYDESPVHQVQLSDFYLAKYPVTQALWKAVMGDNPSYFMGDSRPVEQVTWEDAQAFIHQLNKTTGGQYRLPTEAEWEYAARGGKHSKGYRYAGGNILDDVAWYNENSGDESHGVGLKCPNELSIYDMSGNVLEWCHDWHETYSAESQTDPHGPETGLYHPLRGGGWNDLPRVCRPTYRNAWAPLYQNNYIGFRLALGLPG